jgi:hypothetical protein
MQAELSGFQTTIMNLRQMQGPALRKLEDAAADAIRLVVHPAVQQNITRTDHTLQQLADLDHPYATRHASIQVHPGQTYLVHLQKGKLASSLSSEVARRPGGAGGGAHSVARIGFLRGAPVYAKYVLWGTKMMHGRQVLAETAMRDDVRLKMMRAVVLTLGQKMRSQAGIRFGGA